MELNERYRSTYSSTTTAGGNRKETVGTPAPIKQLIKSAICLKIILNCGMRKEDVLERKGHEPKLETATKGNEKYVCFRFERLEKS